MNRKAYLKPQSEVVRITATSIICGSLGTTDNTPVVDFDTADEGTGISADSRRRSLWDDDDVEEEW